MVMPRMAPAAEPHSHTGALVTGGLIIGLIIGAAGGYYGAQLQTTVLTTISNAALQNGNTEPTGEEATDTATVNAYNEIDTNPLQDVQTNPFE